MVNPWATWANLLTAIRLASLPAICCAIYFSDWGLAAVLFTIAVVSDVYDGRLARRFNQQTHFGGAFDHTTDALFVAACCAVMASQQLVAVALAPLILLSFIQYLLDSKALAGQPLRASIIGRCNGIAYFALVGTVIGAQVLGFTWILVLAKWAAMLLVFSTIISMLDRAIALFGIRKKATDDTQ